MLLSKELVSYQDKLYWIYRKVKQSHLVEGSIQELKEFWLCDVAVKNRFNNDDVVLFLREIEDATIVSESPSNTI